MRFFLCPPCTLGISFAIFAVSNNLWDSLPEISFQKKIYRFIRAVEVWRKYISAFPRVVRHTVPGTFNFIYIMSNNHQPSQTPNSGKINGHAFVRPTSPPNVKVLLSHRCALETYTALGFALESMLLLVTSGDEIFDLNHYRCNAECLIELKQQIQPYVEATLANDIEDYNERNAVNS